MPPSFDNYSPPRNSEYTGNTATMDVSQMNEEERETEIRRLNLEIRRLERLMAGDAEAGMGREPGQWITPLEVAKKVCTDRKKEIEQRQRDEDERLQAVRAPTPSSQDSDSTVPTPIRARHNTSPQSESSDRNDSSPESGRSDSDGSE